MRVPLSVGVAATAIVTAPPAFAGSGSVTIELPKQEANPYRKPYVGVWLEDGGGRPVKMLAVFHDQSRVGERWLPELRTWWRVGGRAMDMPADGISRPTQAPGRQTVGISGLNALAPGKYALVVEAAREKGGRELLKVPFDLRPGKTASASVQGNTELGKVSVSIRP